MIWFTLPHTLDQIHHNSWASPLVITVNPVTDIDRLQPTFELDSLTQASRGAEQEMLTVAKSS